MYQNFANSSFEEFNWGEKEETFGIEEGLEYENLVE